MNTYLNRLKSVQRLLQQHSVDALLIEQPANLFYLTGLELSAGKLLLSLSGAILFVDGRYLELCRENSPFPVQLYEQAKFGQALLPLKAIHTLGVESDKISYDTYRELDKQLQALPRKITLVPLQNPLRQMRMIKEASEIHKLHAAASLGSAGFEYLRSILQEGISEAEAAFELEIFWKKQGAQKAAFEPIIAFGANSSMPHYRAGTARLKRDQIVLIDIGVQLDHYCSDMTRTLFFGTPDPQLLEVHAIVQRAQKAALQLCRPGVHLGELDVAARTLIKEEGYGAQFIHSLGHGVGLEVHEFPTIKNAEPYREIALESGMVVTIEPGIYLPGKGGVRIEDTILITPSGYKNLTGKGQ